MLPLSWGMVSSSPEISSDSVKENEKKQFIEESYKKDSENRSKTRWCLWLELKNSVPVWILSFKRRRTWAQNFIQDNRKNRLTFAFPISSYLTPWKISVLHDILHSWHMFSQTETRQRGQRCFINKLMIQFEMSVNKPWPYFLL